MGGLTSVPFCYTSVTWPVCSVTIDTWEITRQWNQWRWWHLIPNVVSPPVIMDAPQWWFSKICFGHFLNLWMNFVVFIIWVLLFVRPIFRKTLQCPKREMSTRTCIEHYRENASLKFQICIHCSVFFLKWWMGTHQSEDTLLVNIRLLVIGYL